MTDKTIEKRREIGGDCFVLIKSNKSTYKLEHYLNFDLNLYFIYKLTRHQKEVSYNEFLDFNYSGYIFFKKSKYNNIEINKWIEWFIINLGGIMYLSRPFPPLEIMNKIKIKK